MLTPLPCCSIIAGDGVPINPAIAHRLLEELAAAGNPEAQADVGAYLAIGLAPVAPNAKGHIFTLVEPDLPAALVHYYFAATAGDPIAQMALGYRHMHGHGVVKSCQTAALYYLPVAEKVLEMAKMHEGLPELRTFRLSHKSAHSRPQPNAEQEFLHYKWFADYGHADAARAVAHLLANRGVREYEEAVRYLRQAADAGDVDAMAHLGHIYANGIAVEQSNSTAWRWFWRAAEQGERDQQTAVSRRTSHMQPYGRLMLDFCQRSVFSLALPTVGHPAGMFGLGYMHLTGQGAEVDHKQALDYFRHAVEAGQDWQGLGDGLFYLGECREHEKEDKNRRGRDLFRYFLGRSGCGEKCIFALSAAVPEWLRGRI